MSEMTRMVLEDVWAPRMLSVLRIVAALVLVACGARMLLDVPGPEVMLDARLRPGLAGLLEIVGGALLVLGLFTRPAAAVMSGQLMITYFTTRVSQELPSTLNGGDAVLLCCVVFLYVVVAGPGPWSLDEVWARRRAVHTGPLS